MISKESVDLYKSIKAPEGLKERVLSYDPSKSTSYKKKKQYTRFLKVAGSLAACLVLIAGIAIPIGLSQGRQGLFMDGQQVGIKPLVLEENNQERSLSRMQKDMEVSLEIRENATLEVTAGYLKIHGSENQLAKANEPIAVEENTNVFWSVTGMEPYELKVTTKKSIKTYEIYQEKTSKEYYMKLKEKQKL